MWRSYYRYYVQVKRDGRISQTYFRNSSKLYRGEKEKKLRKEGQNSESLKRYIENLMVGKNVSQVFSRAIISSNTTLITMVTQGINSQKLAQILMQ